MPVYYPTEDTDLNIARGLVKSTSVRNIFGKALETTSIVTAEYRTPWEFASDYTFPPSALTMTVTSTIGTTADDGVEVLIIGLDTNWNIISETATINNATPYTTSNQYLRVNDTIITSGAPTGNIDVKNGASTYARILVGTGKCQKAVFSVPAGYSFYLRRIDAFATDSNGGKAAFFRNFVKNNVNGVEFRVAETQFYVNMNILRQLPFKYGQKQDIKLQLKSSSGSIDGSIFAEGVLIKEPLDQ
jgi:hypothetical protein